MLSKPSEVGESDNEDTEIREEAWGRSWVGTRKSAHSVTFAWDSLHDPHQRQINASGRAGWVINGRAQSSFTSLLGTPFDF